MPRDISTEATLFHWTKVAGTERPGQLLGVAKAHRSQPPCGEILQCAKAAIKFGGRQPSLSVERAQKI